MPSSTFSQASDYPDIVQELPSALTWILQLLNRNQVTVTLCQTLSTSRTYSFCSTVHYTIFAVHEVLFVYHVWYKYAINLHIPGQFRWYNKQATGWMDWSLNPSGRRFSPLQTCSDQLWGLHSLQLLRVLKFFPPRVIQLKCVQLKRDINHSPSSSTKGEINWGYTSTHPLCLHDIYGTILLYFIKPILAKLIQQYSC